MHQIILCSCPDQKTAEEIATHLVKGKLAACVNIIAGVTSIYEWQGQIEKS
ncbi:MAG: divalent cation tolerance protein CutA, partial [Methylococcaceae bacterium]|nr:divalent cation tolerance protein CutA [Methylococcaceae bacterium]